MKISLQSVEKVKKELGLVMESLSECTLPGLFSVSSVVIQIQKEITSNGKAPPLSPTSLDNSSIKVDNPEVKRRALSVRLTTIKGIFHQSTILF